MIWTGWKVVKHKYEEAVDRERVWRRGEQMGRPGREKLPGGGGVPKLGLGGWKRSAEALRETVLSQKVLGRGGEHGLEHGWLGAGTEVRLAGAEGSWGAGGVGAD